MENKNDKIQVHLPYPLLLGRYDEVMATGIDPEIYIDGEEIETADRDFLRRAGSDFSARGLRITQHGPYIGLNPASPDEERRGLTVRRYRAAFEAAEALGAVNIVLHAGYSRRTFGSDIDRWMECSMKTWPEFAARAEDAGITIAVENILEREPSPLKRLVEEMDSPALRLCIDSGHLNVFSEVDFEEWFETLGPHIAELHLHDNNGEVDEHLPLGEGSIDFVRYFSLLAKYDVRPIYTIEPHSEDAFRRAIEAARRFIAAPGARG